MKTRTSALILGLSILWGCQGGLNQQQLAPDAPPANPPAVSNNDAGVVPPKPLPDFEPGPPVVRRLTTSEYVQSIEAVLLNPVPAIDLEQDTAVNGSSAVGAATNSLSPRGTELYEDAARAISQDIMRDPSKRSLLISCSRQDLTPDGCVRDFVSTIGRRLWRRSLTEDEIRRYVSIAAFSVGKMGGDMWTGLEYVLAGMLQSPHFLYRVEYGQPDPDDPTRRRLTPLELASKMSYLLWGQGPDSALLDAAEQGELETRDQLLAQARRMIDAPQARLALRNFWTEYFDIKGLENTTRDPMTYPDVDEALMKAMKTETLSVMEDLVFVRKADMREMFTTRATFVNAKLATHYGVPMPAAETRDGFAQVTLPAELGRVGVLGHASFLTKHAHAVYTSPTHRGLFVRQNLLCQTIPAPPPDVDTTFPEFSDESGVKTVRQRLELYSKKFPTCGGCHSLMDPIGFAFENFDAVGHARLTDNGEPVQTDGSLDGVSYDDSVGLAQELAQRPEAMSCMVRKLYRHANGRVESAEEIRAINSIDEMFRDSGYRFETLLLSLILSDGFLTIDPAKQD